MSNRMNINGLTDIGKPNSFWKQPIKFFVNSFLILPTGLLFLVISKKPTTSERCKRQALEGRYQNVTIYDKIIIINWMKWTF